MSLFHTDLLRLRYIRSSTEYEVAGLQVIYHRILGENKVYQEEEP